MNRRSVLVGTGAALGSVFLPGLASTERDDPVAVRVWVTEAAADYPGLSDRVTGYLRAAFRAAGISVDLSVSDVTPRLSASNDRFVRRVTWPLAVRLGSTGRESIDPVRDVNLLITDGDPSAETAGFASANIAAVAGARRLAAMPPAADTPVVTDYSVPAVLTQLVLHECGHAMGLSHDHGTVSFEDTAATVSPMVNGYAWAAEPVRERHLDTSVNACGEPARRVTGERRRLALRYSECATAALGGVSGRS